MATPFTAPPIDTSGLDLEYKRADVELLGVDHSGASYQGRVFVNNRQATADTPPLPEHGYLGSFHIFGHGGCLGDRGHCDVKTRRAYDPRPGHPLTRARKVVIASDALRAACGGEVTVTVVPIVRSVGPRSVADDDDLVSIEGVRIVTYR